MGWSHIAMTTRCQHIPDELRQAIAKQFGGLLWAETRRIDLGVVIVEITAEPDPVGVMGLFPQSHEVTELLLGRIKRSQPVTHQAEYDRQLGR